MNDEKPMNDSASSEAISLVVHFFRVLNILSDRKWFVLGWTFGLALVMVVVVLLLPSRYTSTVVVLTPSGNEGKLGSIAGLSSIGDMLGIKLPGGENPENLLSSIIEARQLALTTVEEFRLDTVWGIRSKYPEDRIRAWHENFTFEFDEQGAMAMAFEDEDPARAQKVLEAVVRSIDSIYRVVNQERSRRSLLFFDSRIVERKRLLDLAEDSLVGFQATSGTFEPDEQLKQSIIQVAKMEAEIQQVGIQADLVRIASGRNSSEALRLAALKSQVARRLERLVSSDSASNSSVVKELRPALQNKLAFERLSRQVLVHGTVYAFLIQQREQAALEASRNIPVLVTLDPPNLPAKRTFPKRRTYVQAAAMLGMLGSMIWVLLSWWLSTSEASEVRLELRRFRERLFRWT